MKLFDHYKHIIWDWNGTLLDDVEYCAGIMNKLLEQESLPHISVEQYKNIFTFPVIEYYKLAGHTFERKSFEELGLQFMEEYETGKQNCKLHKSVNEILSLIKSKNITQHLLSAYQQDLLENTVYNYKLSEYFVNIIGLDNIYAGSKVHFAHQLISKIRFNENPTNILLIGDTEHDYEVAQSIGVDCILISAGHQSKEKLSGLNNVLIIDDLKSLLTLNNQQETN